MSIKFVEFKDIKLINYFNHMKNECQIEEKLNFYVYLNE